MQRTLVDIGSIPNELRQLRQWVCWKYVQKPGEDKPTKVPIDAKNGQYASVNKSYTWATFREAVLFYTHRPEICGIGFVMTGKEGIIGIDIDGRVDQKLINLFDSYSELTPSGNGCRIFVKADARLTTKKKADVEIYNNLRFFTVTGNVLHKAGVNDRQKQFEEFYASITTDTATNAPGPFKPLPPATKQQQQTTRPVRTRQPVSDEDTKLLQRIFTYDQYGALHRMRFEGNIPQSDYRKDSSGKYVPDNSLAAYYLTLCFYNWTQDTATVVRLLRASALYYPKWDEIRNGLTFIEEDVQRVLQKYQTKKAENFKVENFRKDE